MSRWTIVDIHGDYNEEFNTLDEARAYAGESEIEIEYYLDLDNGDEVDASKDWEEREEALRQSIKDTSFYKSLEFDIERLEDRIKSIAEKVVDDPAYISWGSMSTMFADRARLSVLRRIKGAVEERDCASAIAYLDNAADSALRSGFHTSSNPVSNILDSDLAEAWYQTWVDEEGFSCEKRGLIKAYEEVAK